MHRWASPGSGQAVCECSHLTTFAVVADTVDYVQAVLLSAGDIDAEVGGRVDEGLLGTPPAVV